MARLFLPFLVGVLALPGAVVSQAQTSTVTSGPNGVSGSTTVTAGPNGKPCKVVHSEAGTGAVSSSVTAGPDGVRSSSSGGTSVTTRSTHGATGSAVSTSGTGTTTTITGDGDCVVTVPKDRK